LDRRVDLFLDLGHLRVQRVEVWSEDNDDLHRRLRNDRRRTPAERYERDLAEEVAGPELIDHFPFVDDLSAAVRDREELVREAPFLDEVLTFGDVNFVGEASDRFALLLRESAEEWDLFQPV